ncbi:sugar-phosphatase [Azospirillum lipoferum]|uniref:HAD-IA family hydrolase n=1 Tax=Azospirillum lipoferum TaxID=193 RepID=A0A5A9GFS4_AZOLI|nr:MULTISPECIES: HAD-IA family hydrolase [Azospirillum]KAA0593177.1 HAD-IA family hydrolase [Azospirillum lipoferum]MCP1613582.1 sugar-phosphatase [Azospirillum lipoferum]MDW5532345.1 HAD-IA family hydrolase [Azospirillum sp. NL1]
MRTTDAILFDAVLFDMDGTVLNSIKAAERIWTTWALRHGIDVEAFLPTIHGVRAVETIRRLGLPGVDPEVEAGAITQAEIEDVDGIEEIAGAAGFLAALPPDRWAVVTSAPRTLALRRIAAAGLPTPPLLVGAEDVERGKPAPDCFQLAAERLGTTADRCLVVEDSPAGIAAAVSAGASVLVITATHHAAAGATAVDAGHAAIRDYRDLAISRLADGSLSIRAAQGGGLPSNASPVRLSYGLRASSERG